MYTCVFIHSYMTARMQKSYAYIHTTHKCTSLACVPLCVKEICDVRL